MNQQLTEQIAYHVLANLGALPAPFINKETTKSLLDKQFMLPERITFEVDGETVKKNIFGCQVTVADGKDFKMLIIDCTQEKELPEFCLLINLKDAPCYGVYFVYSGLVDEAVDSEALIAVSTDKQHWMPCSTYLQATFLAGMEQIRDIPMGWAKCANYQEQYQQLLSFIKFHHNYYEATDEGQEV
jgi:hypothetical protein